VQPVALLQAVLSNTLRANQIVSGIGINILVLGATTLAYREIFGRVARENSRASARSSALLGDIPVLGPAVFEQVWAAVCRIALIVLTGIGAAHTSIGLAIPRRRRRAQGGRQIGLSVTRIRYGCVLFAGFMASLAGAFLSNRRHPHLHRGHDPRRRLSRHRLGALRQMAGRRHGAGLPVVRAATALQFQLPALGVDVPNALLIMLLICLRFSGGGLVGRQMAPATPREPYRR